MKNKPEPLTNDLIKGFGNQTISLSENYKQRIKEIMQAIQIVIDNLIKEINESNKLDLDILDIK